MRVIVSAESHGLSAKTSSVFGRCPAYVFFDAETRTVESCANPAQNAPGGAGIQAAQFVIAQGARIVLTGNLGPNAIEVLVAAQVEAYRVGDTTVRQALDDLAAGSLERLTEALVSEHSGLQSAETDAEQELRALRTRLVELRRELDQIVQRIESLQKEG